MLSFKLDPKSLTTITEHADELVTRMMVGIRLGMRDGVKALARAEAEAVAGHTRTGNLERILSRAGRVFETDDVIAAIYRPRSQGLQPHYWLEYGIHDPEVSGTLLAMNIEGERIFRMGHRAFATKGQDYFFTTAEAFRESFFEILKGRVKQAMEAE